MARALAVVWTLAIVAGLSLPGEVLGPFPILSYDKLYHAAAFLVFGGLWLWVYPARAGRVLAAGLLFAVLGEVYQHLMPINRTFDLYDALADALGLTLSLGVGLWWAPRRRAPA